MKFKIFIVALLTCFLPSSLSAQNNMKAVFRESKPGFYQTSIMKDDREVAERTEPARVRRTFAADLSNLQVPNKTDLYKNQQWHNPPISQGNTGTCWCFSTTSFLESEAYRINKVKVKLSEIYTVYWEYVEKARRFIRERGNSEFGEGSEANAVKRIWKKYGVVPAEAYSGLLNERKYHNHENMFNEMNSFLQSLKANSSWNEEDAVSTIKSIMNHYLGEPPAQVTVSGKQITPQQYLTDVLKLNPDDYVDILSYIQEPFWQQVEYKVPDNWWHNADYFNIPLDVYMSTLKDIVRKGYTVSIGGDVSEPGFDRNTQCAVIPEFDIPSAYINDDARQFRFSNKTTTDDHGMHLVGYLEKDGKDWYLIKDSSAGSRNNDASAKEFGYYFFTEDYVKLKMMDYMVHKDAVKDLLGKFEK
ncbi:MAG TPA: C1 family peptidase [Bacteroidales bacterium]|nr:C1 family peptidase [Bacteroidales bacterium]